jgi:hypothetical protein
MVRRWLGSRSCPTRSTSSGPSRRKTSATSRMRMRRQGQRSAMRVARGAGPPSRSGGVRGVERAGGLGRWGPRQSWMPRSDTPRARRWVAAAGTPRLEGGLLGKAALAHPRVAGLVAGGGGHRRRPRPGWEQPGTGPRALPVRPDQRPPPGGQWPAAGLAPLAAPALPQPPVRGPV